MSKSTRTTRSGLLVPVLLSGLLAAFSGPPPGARDQTAPASGYVYYGDARLGEDWSTRNFDNLTRTDTPAFRGTEPADLAIREGDVLRARRAVNVRERPWTAQPDEPRIVGVLRAGERVVVREIHWVGLAPGLQRSAFWIRYERAGPG